MAELIKIAIVGPESSGKTFLAEKLASHFNCNWVPEYARPYLENINHPYTREDVERIARGQIKSESEVEKKSESLLICDTNLLVIKIWMDHKYGHTPEWIEKETKNRYYNLHLLTVPDIEYEYDPLRENPEMGQYFFEKFESLLKINEIPYSTISGSEEQRLHKAVSIIEKIKAARYK